MARILKGGKVDDIRGKVGNLVFAKVRGAAVVKRHIQGPDRKSNSQLSVRSAFTIAKDSWLSLSAEIINAWTRFAGDLRGTGYNFFLSANIAQERADDWRILTPVNYRVNPVGSMETESGLAEGEITISWEAGTANPSHRVWAFVREVETSVVVHKAWWEDDVSVGEVVVDGLTVGKEYRLYISVFDSAQDEGWKFSQSLEYLGEGEEGPEPTVDFYAGHETGDLTEWNSIGLRGDSKIEADPSAAKAGVYSVRAEILDPDTGDYARCYKWDLDMGVGRNIYLSGWWRLAAGFNLTNWLFLSKVEQWGPPYKGMKTILNADEELLIYDDINGASYLQDSPISVPSGQWVGIEMRIFTHETAGVLELWQDAARIIRVTGIDTMPSSNYFKILYGLYYNAGVQVYDLDLRFDEVYVQDLRKII